MAGFNIFFSVLLPAVTLLINSCAPTPMLQSPRVTSSCSIGPTWSAEWIGTDSGGIRIEPEFVPLNFSWGIAKRVEITALALPYLLYGYIINGQVKCFVNEYGRPSFFRNVSYAAVAGGHAIQGEWERDFAAYIGGIFATRHTGAHQELELIVLPSYYQAHRLTRYDGQPRRHFINDGIQCNFGTIFAPYHSGWFRVEFITGGVYRRPFTRFENAGGEYNRTRRNWSFQCGVMLGFGPGGW